MKKFIISNYNKIILSLWLGILILLCIGFVKKNLKYFDIIFYLLLTFFLIFIFLRKEILVVQITKEIKDLKPEELMKCDSVFLDKILFIILNKKREVKNKEIEEKILDEIIFKE